METLKDIKEGDIFYIPFNKKYYFMQIIHITKDLPPPYDVDYKYGYFIILFEKSFNELPETIEDLDLMNIYKIKYKPKDTILFISHWDIAPEIKLNSDMDNYKKYSKYGVKYFGNAKISKEFNPKIDTGFILPAKYKANDDGIRISHTPVDISWIFYRLEEDEKNRNKRFKGIKVKYFKKWLEIIEPEIIIKIENIIQKYENANENISRELRKCINAINKLNEKNNFIMTIEAEDIYDLLEELSKKHGIKDFEKTIEDNREW
ncbi:MAG: hypothetical protein LBK13_01565 [Spirochaetales bacterium]|jgi:hypothetical protein|nr:hypothetical protein [Spirochaetales bacterium]